MICPSCEHERPARPRRPPWSRARRVFGLEPLPARCTAPANEDPGGVGGYPCLCPDTFHA